MCQPEGGEMKRRHPIAAVVVVLAAGLSFAASPARGLVSDVTVTPTQACDGPGVTLLVTVSGLVLGEEDRFVVLRDGLAVVASDYFPDANGNVILTNPGWPSFSTVVVNVFRGGSTTLLGTAGPFTLIDCSPSAQLTALVAQVQGLDVSAGIANSLDAKLSHIQDALDAAKSNSVGVA